MKRVAAFAVLALACAEAMAAGDALPRDWRRELHRRRDSTSDPYRVKA